MVTNIMEFIWENAVQKDEDGHARFSRGDLELLWHTGFVDTKQYPLNTWLAAFDDCLQSDGTYLVSKEAFIAKEPYRYKGIIRIPFDPLKINEGKYTEEGLNELIENSIKPSIDYPPDKLHQFFKDFKKRYRAPDGLIEMNIAGKREIKELVDNNPSPLRCLELIYEELATTIAIAQETQLQPVANDNETAKIQASVFLSTPPSKTEALCQKLKSLEDTGRPQNTAPDTSEKCIELKNLIRKKKGLRG